MWRFATSRSQSTDSKVLSFEQSIRLVMFCDATPLNAVNKGLRLCDVHAHDPADDNSTVASLL